MKQGKGWTFVTNHGLVLLYISQHPQCTTREIASIIGATERTVHRVLMDLQNGGYITRQRSARGNIYEVNYTRELRHELTRYALVGKLIKSLGRKSKTKGQRRKTS